MTELPLVIINVQRGGPSTGLPTKTEQADLMQALYGRNGECPVVVIAASTPSDCFHYAFEAGRIALEHMTPVLLLTDGFLANGTEPWKIPEMKDLPKINPPFADKKKYLFFLIREIVRRLQDRGQSREHQGLNTGSEVLKKPLRVQFPIFLKTMR